MSERWMLYGANGFTGRLISRLAVRRAMRPLLAGRTAQRVEPLAGELGLEARVVDLEDAQRLRAALEDVRVVLHAAGPFIDTAQPMLEACLASRTHYLDITGEIEVFERIFARRGKAEVAGVALIPGVGFDVVPTDGLAAMLAGRLPDATHLELAFHSRGPASPGTSRTIVRNLPRGGAVRADGRIVGVPQAWKTRRIPFADASRLGVSIGWGDVSTAYWSTGIGNVIVYMAAPPRRVKWMRRSDRLRRLFGTRLAQRALAAWAVRKNRGPGEQELEQGVCEVWGEARNGSGETVCGTLTTPNGYALTADASVKAVERVLRGVPPGAWTPSRAFGIGFLDELEGVRIRTWAG